MAKAKKTKREEALRLLQRATKPDFGGLLTASTLIVGIGSSGSEVVLMLFRILQDWLDPLPLSVKFLLIDADKDPRTDNLPEKSQIVFIPTGKDGAGTNTFNGRKLALKKYADILTTMEQSMVELMEVDDPRFPTNLSGSELQAVYLVGGSSGGTSGGTTDLAITIAHHAARNIGLERLDVNLVSIGATMPVVDVTRSVDPQTRTRIAANSADNYQAWYSMMNTRRLLEETPPNFDAFTTHSSTRIYSKIEFDNRSNSSMIHRNADLHAMMAACLQKRIFTAAGKEREARYCDEVINGTSGQAHPATAERT